MFSFVTASMLAQMHWGMDWDQAGWFWMTLMMIGGAILVVVVVFLFLRAYSERSPGIERTGDTPLDVAKRRYAAGEITSEEFEKIKKDIG